MDFRFITKRRVDPETYELTWECQPIRKQMVLTIYTKNRERFLLLRSINLTTGAGTFRFPTNLPDHEIYLEGEGSSELVLEPAERAEPTEPPPIFHEDWLDEPVREPIPDRAEQLLPAREPDRVPNQTRGRVVRGPETREMPSLFSFLTFFCMIFFVILISCIVTTHVHRPKNDFIIS